MFANKYLQKNSNVSLISTEPKSNTGIIVVIPCFREPDILKTLKSINSCRLPEVHLEVIVLINHSEIQNEDTKEYNRETKIAVDKWIGNNRNTGICFFAPGPIELKKKWAGAGLARKSGMDEAVRRFNFLNKRDGIIVSLDADTTVEPNYLLEIEKHFKANPKHVGATIAFQHQKENLNARQLEGINLYEKYLAYYKGALHYSGYPYSMFTIGSAFVVNALAYVKRGGMNRRQAGEDFYFLQNLVQIGTVGEIESTCVYPSARLSDRVPFGTGPILQKWMNGQEDLNKSYNFKSFEDLKELFSKKENLYKIDGLAFEAILNMLPNSIAAFLKRDNFWDELNELNKNCSKLETFETRFFHKFNAFKILKYLNFAEEKFYKKAVLEEQVTLLNQEKQA